MSSEKAFREILPDDHITSGVRSLVRRGSCSDVLALPHWHEKMELILVREGSGLQKISRSGFLLSAGEIAVIGPNQVHSFTPDESSGPFDLLILQFSLDQLLQDLDSETPFCKDWQSGRLCFSGPVPANPSRGELMEFIRRELSGREPGRDCAVRGALQVLLAGLYRESAGRMSGTAAAVSDTRTRAVINPAISLITENYADETLSPDRAAQLASLSLTHFCRLFRQATGMGFHEYLNRYRIICAEQHFSKNESLTEIAYLCGFGSSSAFLRNYKKYRGVSPQQARSQFLQSGIQSMADQGR